MNIQSISIVVPTKSCVNNCPFCVSRMHSNDYENKFDPIQIKKRIKFAVNNGVNTCIITGTGEPLQNLPFIEKLTKIFEEMDHPFPNVEIQTTGIFLNKAIPYISEDNENSFNEYPLLHIIRKLGVNTISLSVSDIFCSENNMDIIGTPKKLRFKLKELTSLIKEEGFNLRLSLNMTKSYSDRPVEEILGRAKFLGADQITVRKLWASDNDSIETKWVLNNSAKQDVIDQFNAHVAGWEDGDGHGNTWMVPGKGTPLYRLPFGPMVYSIDGMSTVIDDNCMSEHENEKLKYVILRENGKLYAQWNDEGSLIF